MESRRNILGIGMPASGSIPLLCFCDPSAQEFCPFELCRVSLSGPSQCGWFPRLGRLHSGSEPGKCRQETFQAKRSQKSPLGHSMGRQSPGTATFPRFSGLPQGEECFTAFRGLFLFQMWWWANGRKDVSWRRVDCSYIGSVAQRSPNIKIQWFWNNVYLGYCFKGL